MVRAFEPKKYYIEHSRASKKSSQAEPSFWKHVAHEPNFEPSLGSTQPYTSDLDFTASFTNFSNPFFGSTC